ncbi:hypothetical protein [Ewingella americana]|uniref:Uncharacterized protein n=1 Tax=Ewingella americana TaxID=41202 RepID=A0A502GFA6_9GAMM|nr:hypothetical protein [Ewingella americana]TPG59970.1 hypothetical protein EAH77_15500 [Ewingella americana]
MTASILLRLKIKDTPNGVSAETLDRLTQHLELSKTDTIHMALVKLAEDYLPGYKQEQIQREIQRDIAENGYPQLALVK